MLSTWASRSRGIIVPGYEYMQGTSMAAPHVSGVAALMKTVLPSLGADAFDAMLAAGRLTVDLGPTGRDERFGYGLIDAYRAVLAVSGGAPPSGPALRVIPDSLNFGPLGESLELELNQVGSGSLSVTAVEDDAAWLRVEADNVDRDGLGRYRVQVDRGGLPEGTYSATIRVGSTANSVSVPVIMQRLELGGDGDAGTLYVVLEEIFGGDSLRSDGLRAQQGGYDFAFPEAAEGVYRLYAGSDADNGGLICGAAEACGAYPTLGRPALITLDSNRSGVDFVTTFRGSVSGSSAGTRQTPAP